MPSSSVSPSSTRSGATSTSPTSRTSIISPATSTSTDTTFESPPWILHHILETRTTGELPLSIMFAINSGQSIPRLKEIYSYWQLDPQGKLVLAFLSSQDRITPSIADATLAEIRNPKLAAAEPGFDPLHCPDDRFMDPGNEKLLKISFAHLLDNAAKQEIDFDPKNRKTLPAHFVRKFCLERVFVSDFQDVDFGHALTALDYLRDLECSRRNALLKAAGDLGITESNWRRVLWGNPTASQWVEDAQKDELRIETMYSDLFLDLRIWTMTSVLLAKDFNKTAALAMLNTLFPPAIQDLPNSKVNPRILYEQRAIFYRLTMHVDEHGPEMAISFKEKLSQPDNRHKWPAVRGTLEKYANLAGKMIEKAGEASGMLNLYSPELLAALRPINKRGFTAISFEAFDNPRTAPKTPKAKASMGDLRSKFTLNKKPSQVFEGLRDAVYSKSMVNVSRPQKESITSSPVQIRGRNPEPRIPVPRDPEPRVPEPRDLGGSRTAPAKSQPTFDNLISTRVRGLSKPMGFVPPPLDEVDKLVGRGLMPSPWDAAAKKDIETPGSTPKVSFDFDSALGLRGNAGHQLFSSDVETPVRSRKSKPNLQIDTETVTRDQAGVSPCMQSALPFPKYEEPENFSESRPQTAPDSDFRKKPWKNRGPSKKLYSGFQSPQTERFPPLATLPIMRREITEPALIPEPLNINRQRKPSAPGTSNLGSFSPRDNDRPWLAPRSAKSITFPEFPRNIINLNPPSQESNDPLVVKKVISNSRPSISAEASRPVQRPSTGSSSVPQRLPSDNLEFLTRPYTASSSDTDHRSPIIMKKPSLSNFFTGRRKKSTPALADEFSRGDGLGISTEGYGATDENEAARKQVKKKISMSALIHGKSEQKEKTSDHDQDQDTATNIPESGELATAQDPAIKKKSSVSAFIHGLMGNKKATDDHDQRAHPVSQKPDESPRITGILKNNQSLNNFKNDNPTTKATPQQQDAVPSKTPTSAKSARFGDSLTTSTSHNSASSGKTDMTEQSSSLKIKKSYNFLSNLQTSESRNSFRNERAGGTGGEWVSRKPTFTFPPPGLHYASAKPSKSPASFSTPPSRSEPKLKNKGSFASSAAHPASESTTPLATPQMPAAIEHSQGALKKMSSAIFSPPNLRSSDSQSTIRPERERNVLKKKSFNRNVSDTMTSTSSTSSSEQTPPVLRSKSSKFLGEAMPSPSTSRKFAANSEVGVFAQFEAEQAARRAGKSGEDRNGITVREFLDSGEGAGAGAGGRESKGAYTAFPLGGDEEGDVFGGGGGGGLGGAMGGEALKRKKSLWGGWGKKELSREEKVEKERAKREKEEKREREMERRAKNVLGFAG